jgi:hypothetical protein
LLGRLEKKYGDAAFYVHLQRNNFDTAKSFTKRFGGGIIKAYRGMGILMGVPESTDPMEISLDYCNTVNENIKLFLRDKSKVMTIHLESIVDGFARFWDFVSAEGDLALALKELDIKYNASR